MNNQFDLTINAFHESSFRNPHKSFSYSKISSFSVINFLFVFKQEKYKKVFFYYNNNIAFKKIVMSEGLIAIHKYETYIKDYMNEE